MSTSLSVLLASFISCLVTTAGIFVIIKFEKWGNKNAVYFMSFAAGVLISVSFMHIIPTSFGMIDSAPTFLLVGFMGLYIINRFINILFCHDHNYYNLTTGVIPMIGIGLHSLIDGIIYSITFNVSIFTGALAAIGMILHEFPEGIVTFVLLERSGFPRKKSAFYAFLAAGISTPLGTVISFPFVDKISFPLLGILLAISAGALVYVGASHLLPAVEKENRKFSLFLLLVGILVAIFIVTSQK
jgi:zinc and cadmium transporter